MNARRTEVETGRAPHDTGRAPRAAGDAAQAAGDGLALPRWGANALIGAVVLFFPLYWIVYGHGFLDARFVDAKSFWLGARLALVEGLSPYPWETFSAASERAPGGYAHPFVYPPPSLVLLWPLAGLGYGQATTALLAASHAGLLLTALGGGRILFADRPGQSRATLAVVAGLAIFLAASHAARVTLGHGQVNVFVVCGLVWFWAACLGRAPAAIGAAGLVVATLLKPYFGVFALYLLLPGGRRLLLPVLVLCAALLVATLLAVPAAAWGDWVRIYLLGLSQDGLYLGRFDVYGPENFALRAALDAVVGPGTRALWPWLVPAMALAQLAAILRLRDAQADARTIQMAGLTLLVFLAAPVSWIHYLLYVVVASALVLVVALRGRRPVLAAVAGLTGATLLQPTALGAVHPLAVYAPVFLAALLWIACLAQAAAAAEEPA